MKVKTAGLTGAALDWAVAKWCREQVRIYPLGGEDFELLLPSGDRFEPSTNWADGGPLIERYDLMFERYAPSPQDDGRKFLCYAGGDGRQGTLGIGASHLEAAMRMVVARGFGEEMEIPDELGALAEDPAGAAVPAPGM